MSNINAKSPPPNWTRRNPVTPKRAKELVQKKAEHTGLPPAGPKAPCDKTKPSRVKQLISQFEPVQTPPDINVPPPTDLPPLRPLTTARTDYDVPAPADVPPPWDLPPTLPEQYEPKQPEQYLIATDARRSGTAWNARQGRHSVQRSQLIGAQTIRRATKAQPDTGLESTESKTSSTWNNLTGKHTATDQLKSPQRPASPTPLARPIKTEPKEETPAFHVTQFMQDVMKSIATSPSKDKSAASTAASTFMLDVTRHAGDPVNQLKASVAFLGLVAEKLPNSTDMRKLGDALEDSWSVETQYAKNNNNASYPDSPAWKQCKTFAGKTPDRKSFSTFAMQATTRMDMPLGELKRLDDEFRAGLSTEKLNKNRFQSGKTLDEVKQCYELAKRNLTTLSTWATYAACNAKDTEIQVQALCLAKALDTVKDHLLAKGTHIGNLWADLVVQPATNVTVEKGAQPNRVRRAIGTRRQDAGGTQTVHNHGGSTREGNVKQ